MTAANVSLALRPRGLQAMLATAIKHRLPVLIKGAPGVGKSDIVAQAVREAGADMILSHPAVADPTDAKGLPWKAADGDHATFLPFGDLDRALKAKKPTVWFLDDLGQAAPAVQASYMQLLLARRVNDHILPEHVTFVAATNRRTDRAGVSGILEPVKSRFASIVELEVHPEDWGDWAIRNDIAPEIIAFIRFRPDLLCDFKPSQDLTNSPSPRTWARVSAWMKAGLAREIEHQVYAGAVGEGPATEFVSFLKIARDLPSIDEILLAPDTAPIPTKPAELYAITSGLALKSNAANFDRVTTYLLRMAAEKRVEFAVFCVRAAYGRDSKISNTKGWVQLSQSEVGKVFTGAVAND